MLPWHTSVIAIHMRLILYNHRAGGFEDDEVSDEDSNSFRNEYKELDGSIDVELDAPNAGVTGLAALRMPYHLPTLHESDTK